jgi:hypothetical protein
MGVKHESFSRNLGTVRILYVYSAVIYVILKGFLDWIQAGFRKQG